MDAFLEEYFNAVAAGDTDAIESMHAEGMKPSRDELEIWAAGMSMIEMEYSNVKTETLSESADEAEVELKDYKVTLSAMGQTESITMGELEDQGMMGDQVTTIALKMEDGEWRINQPEIINPLFGSMPTFDQMPSAPTGGG